MKPHGVMLLTVLALACGLAAGASAQQKDLSKPTVDLVSVVGCASHGSDDTWVLTNATESTVSETVFTSKKEIEEAKNKPLGTNRYRLIGTAEFVSAEELLRQGQRAQFTQKPSANATGQLQNGLKVVVKGLLIIAPNEKRLNLTSVQRLSDTCK